MPYLAKIPQKLYNDKEELRGRERFQTDMSRHSTSSWPSTKRLENTLSEWNKSKGTKRFKTDMSRHNSCEL